MNYTAEEEEEEDEDSQFVKWPSPLRSACVRALFVFVSSFSSLTLIPSWRRNNNLPIHFGEKENLLFSYVKFDLCHVVKLFRFFGKYWWNDFFPKHKAIGVFGNGSINKFSFIHLVVQLSFYQKITEVMSFPGYIVSEWTTNVCLSFFSKCYFR